MLVLVGVLQSALILLPSCGGGSSCNALSNPSAVMFSVATLEGEGNYYGITEFTCDGPTVVRISRDTPHELVPRVVAHEMLHCAGLIEHEASPACYLFKDAFVGQPLVPCSAEVERLVGVLGVYTITVTDSALIDFANGAAQLWNEEVGRTVFIIDDQTPPAGDE